MNKKGLIFKFIIYKKKKKKFFFFYLFILINNKLYLLINYMKIFMEIIK